MKGDRLILRDFVRGDLDDYRRWFTEELEWTRWDAPWERIDGEFAEKYLARLSRSIEREQPVSRKRFEIVHEDTHIGWVSAYYMDEERTQLAVGINIPEKDCWGKKLGKEALELFIQYLSEHGFSTTYCQTWSGNVRMVRLANSLGFVTIDDSRAVEVDGKQYKRLTFRRINTEGFSYGFTHQERNSRRY